MLPKGTETEDLVELGERIRQKRRDRGISQEKLAEEIEVTSNTIHRIENAQVTMRIDKLFQLADVLQSPIEELCPKRFAFHYRDGEMSGLLRVYKKLNDFNRKIVYDTMNTLVQGLLLHQRD